MSDIFLLFLSKIFIEKKTHRPSNYLKILKFSISAKVQQPSNFYKLKK